MDGCCRGGPPCCDVGARGLDSLRRTQQQFRLHTHVLYSTGGCDVDVGLDVRFANGEKARDLDRVEQSASDYIVTCRTGRTYEVRGCDTTQPHCRIRALHSTSIVTDQHGTMKRLADEPGPTSTAIPRRLHILPGALKAVWSIVRRPLSTRVTHHPPVGSPLACLPVTASPVAVKRAAPCGAHRGSISSSTKHQCLPRLLLFQSP